jgi:hypothetical protein
MRRLLLPSLGVALVALAGSLLLAPRMRGFINLESIVYLVAFGVWYLFSVSWFAGVGFIGAMSNERLGVGGIVWSGYVTASIVCAVVVISLHRYFMSLQLNGDDYDLVMHLELALAVNAFAASLLFGIRGACGSRRTSASVRQAP